MKDAEVSTGESRHVRGTFTLVTGKPARDPAYGPTY